MISLKGHKNFNKARDLHIFWATNCSWFIISNLKCLGLCGSTAISLCSHQKLYITIAFGISPSANRVLPWLQASNTLTFLQWCLSHCFYLYPKDSLHNVFARQLSADPFPLSHLAGLHSRIRDFLGHHWAMQLLHFFLNGLLILFLDSSIFTSSPRGRMSFKIWSLSALPLFFIEFTMGTWPRKMVGIYLSCFVGL